MDIITTTTTPASNTTTTTIKTPDADNEPPSRIQPTKPLSFSNGVLKRHHPFHHHHHHHHPPLVVIYKECLKNHAASLGGHALDGCGEFMPSPSATPTDPTSLKCAACGCHRNFHRREPEDPHPPQLNNAVVEFQPHHRHHPPPPRGGSPSSPSPPPISSAYYPASAPHMLLALSAGLSGPQTENNAIGSTVAQIGHPNGRKRFRTKFTQYQKDKMLEFAEKVGWKIQKRDEEQIVEFCSEVGVDRGVLKVWMHNNKSTSGKKDTANSNGGTTAGIISTQYHHHHHHHNSNNDNENNNSTKKHLDRQPHIHSEDISVGTHVNGSSSSS